MEGTRPLASLRRTLQNRINHVLSQRFFHDRLSMSVLTIALVVNVANMFTLVLHLKPTDAEVPVHFSSFILFDQLGPWYFPFEIALVALLITVVNAVFAYHSFTRSRLASFFLLTTALVVGIFAYIIAQAFGGVR